MSLYHQSTIYTHIQKLSNLTNNHIHNIKTINQQFDKHTKNIKSHNGMIGKLNALINTYQIILMDIGTLLEPLNLSNLTEIIFRIFYQMMGLSKWSLKEFMDYRNKAIVIAADNNYKQLKESLNTKQQKNSNQYYKMKETCEMVVNNIQNQLNKMNDQYKIEQQEYACLLKKREKLDSIKPTDRQLILIQAVESLANQSQMFKMFVNSANNKFFEDMKAMNITPYYKIKDELECANNKKLKKAKNHISQILQKHSQQIIKYFKKLNSKTYQSIQIQTDKDQLQQKLKKQLRMKQKQNTQLKKTNSHNMSHISNLEMLIKNKSTYFEKQLSKFKQDQKQRQEIDVLRKSVHELKSAQKIMAIQQQTENNLKDSNNSTYMKNFLQIQNGLDKIRKNSKSNLNKKKKIRFQKEGLNSKNQSRIYINSSINVQQITSLASIAKYNCKYQSQIYNLKINHTTQISPNDSHRSRNKSHKSTKSHKNIQLSIVSNVFHFQSSDVAPENRYARKQSLLMIKSVNPASNQIKRQSKKMQRPTQQFFKSLRQNFVDEEQIKMQKQKRMSTNRVSIRCIQTNQRNRNTITPSDHQINKEIDSNNQSNNKTLRSHKLINQQNTIINKNIKKEKLMQKRQSNCKRIQNVFEIINLDSENLKNKPLKLGNFKRNHHQAVECLVDSTNKKVCKNQIDFCQNDINNVFLGEDNAIQIQVMLGIGKNTSVNQIYSNSNRLYQQLQPLFRSWNQYRKKDFFKLKKFLRYPHSSIYQKLKNFDADSITISTLQQVIGYIYNCHKECILSKKYCVHIQDFLKKLNSTKY